jgi:hypothetical protein
VELTREQYEALCDALGLPRGADLDAVLSQAAGLVNSMFELRQLIYVGIINPVLARHNVALPGW